MRLLRLEPLNGTGIDAAIAAIPGVTLMRRREGSYAELSAAYAPRFVRALAFAGIFARSHGADLATASGLVPSVGTDLAPCAAAHVDSLQIRRLDLGEATAEVTRRRWAYLRPLSACARDRCRSLLRGDDALLGWRRTAWADREVYLDARVRSSLRPLVFDRTAIERVAERRVFAAQGAIAQWLFG